MIGAWLELREYFRMLPNKKDGRSAFGDVVMREGVKVFLMMLVGESLIAIDKRDSHFFNRQDNSKSSFP